LAPRETVLHIQFVTSAAVTVPLTFSATVPKPDCNSPIQKPFRPFA
jgi:hypothetical protein